MLQIFNSVCFIFSSLIFFMLSYFLFLWKFNYTIPLISQILYTFVTIYITIYLLYITIIYYYIFCVLFILWNKLCLIIYIFEILSTNTLMTYVHYKSIVKRYFAKHLATVMSSNTRLFFLIKSSKLSLKHKRFVSGYADDSLNNFQPHSSTRRCFPKRILLGVLSYKYKTTYFNCRLFFSTHQFNFVDNEAIGSPVDLN